MSRVERLWLCFGVGLLASAIKSPEGEREFELAAGESVTVTGMTPRIEACSVSL